VKIVADIAIPYLAEAVRAGWPNVHICPMKPEEIDHEALLDADVLVVRTRTKVDAALLSGTKVRLVCTATIGYDHIDTTWCEQNGVRWSACPGCNAQAVCDYIEEVLNELSAVSRQQSVIGIVGVGHVGALVAEMASCRGLQVLLNDPPKGIGVSLDEIARNSDIITFHTPLDQTTYHLCDANFLSKTRSETLIINAARGGVVDEKALLASGREFVLDTWEGEPDVNAEAVEKARLATMHIAGYSQEGKKRATEMCLEAISQEFDLPILSIDKKVVSLHADYGDSAPGWLRRVSDQLKAQPDRFEQLRKQYKLR
jgi:erythronate-4-phosphate dehydrogenase